MGKNTEQNVESGVDSSEPAEAKWFRAPDAGLHDIQREQIATHQIDLIDGVVPATTLQVSGLLAHKEQNTRNSECHA